MTCTSPFGGGGGGGGGGVTAAAAASCRERLLGTYVAIHDS